MKRTLSKLTLTCVTVLAGASLAVPASAQKICAILQDSSRGALVAISDVGTTPIIICRSVPAICGEGFTICVNSSLAVSSRSSVILTGTPFNLTTTLRNASISASMLKPSTTGASFCHPFILVRDPSTKKFNTVFLPQTGTFDPGSSPALNVPIFEVGNLPPDTEVDLIVENEPATGKCLGVRTTFQFFVGSCRLCKIRKIFNRCKDAQRLTHIKEFELPCFPGIFQPSGARDGFRKVVAATQGSLNTTTVSADLSLGAVGTTGGTVRAGSVLNSSLTTEFNTCIPGNTFSTAVEGTTSMLAARSLEVFINFLPGGVNLKQNQEKFVSVCLEVGCPGTMPSETPPPPVTPPTVMCPTDRMLWPPNHELVDVGFSIMNATGYTVKVYSNEPENGLGDGDTDDDAVCTGTGVQVRRERSGLGNGRIYLIEITATDAAGNTVRRCCTVFIPHDQSAASIAAVTAAANAAEASCNAGTIPTGFNLIETCTFP